MAVGFYEVGQSLLFNKNENNQIMIKGALKIISGLLGNNEWFKEVVAVICFGLLGNVKKRLVKGYILKDIY